MKNIVATKPTFSSEDIDFITRNLEDILQGNSFLSQYKYSEEFESKFAEYIGTDFAVSCNSGTSALELIFRALDVKDKEVILPSNTFIATANAIINAGAKPIFADCNDDMCMDYDSVMSLINKNTIAVCYVHIGGLVSESALQLSAFCLENNIYFVEDAAQAHGSSNMDRKAGSLGVAAGFSFFSTKVMTTGEGGMVTTNDQSLVEKMKSIREFGKVKKGIYTNYHTSLGYNWRMPEVSALMGIRQLLSIESFINERKKIAEIYDSFLCHEKNIRIISPSSNSRFNNFKYIIILNEADRESVHHSLQELGISMSGYVYELPLHKQPVFKPYNHISLPKTEYLCSQHICLPIYPELSKEDAEYISKSLIDVISLT
tara:strand:- start:1209 stop:2330 length:1122 start_codon:yes stop_codon:yes gene_type:complete